MLTCMCVVADARLIRSPAKNMCVMLLSQPELPDLALAASAVWTSFDFSPAAVMLVREALRRWPAFLDALPRLPPAAIHNALQSCSVLGVLDTDTPKTQHSLPPHWTEAARFSREVLMRNLPLVLAQEDGDVVSRAALAMVYELFDRQHVDPRMEDALVPLVRRMIRDREGDLGMITRLLVGGFCRAVTSLEERQWALLRDVVTEHPPSIRAIFRPSHKCILGLIDAVKAHPCLTKLLVATVRAGGDVFRESAAKFLEGDRDTIEWSVQPAEMEVLSALIIAAESLTLIAHAFPKVSSIMSDAASFNTCTRVMVALQMCTSVNLVISNYALGLSLVYGSEAMMGTDPERCAAAVQPLLMVLMCRRVFEKSVSEKTNALARLFNRALALTPANATLVCRRFPITVALMNIFRFSTDAPPTTSMARILAARSDRLAKEVLEAFAPFAATPLAKRVCVILEGNDEKVCEMCDDAKGSTKLCSRCRGVRYCSPKCQAADWSHHKVVCQERFLPNYVVTELDVTAYDFNGTLPWDLETLKGVGSNAPP